MPNKKYKYYSEGYFSLILKLIKEKKFEQALVECEKYLVEYPNDVCANVRYADLLMRFGNLEEAEEILNYVPVTSKTPEVSKEDIKFNKFKLYCYLGKYEECLEMLRNDFGMLENKKYNVTEVLMFLKKKLGLLMCDNYDGSGYKIGQITNYSESSAIECIKKYHINNTDYPSCFNKDFPLEQVYYQMRNMLPLEKKSYEKIIENSYIFKYVNNGKIYGNPTDYIKVYTLLGTNDILTMFPVKYNNREYCTDITPKIEENVKIKRISQIDKFNKRYGIK